MQHTVIALMQDRPGALNRAVSLFRRRNFNIDSLAVATTEIAGLSRMTVVVNQDDVVQLVRQLERLIDIVSVQDVTHDRAVEQEMCMIRLGAPGTRLGDILALAREFDARIVDATPTAMVLSMMDAPTRVSAFLARLAPYGIDELTRSGRIAMCRGANARTSRPAPHAGSRGRPHELTQMPANWQGDGFGDEEAA